MKYKAISFRNLNDEPKIEEEITMLAADAFAIQKAMIGSDLSPAARTILRVLMDFSDKVGECFPAVSTVMERCGYCDRTVRSKIKELVSKGWLIKTEQFRKNGSQTSNHYIIQQPKMVMEQDQDSAEEPMMLSAVTDEHQDIVEQADTSVVQMESGDEQKGSFEKKAQKKEALLGKATPPRMTSTHDESSNDVNNDKPILEPLSSVILNSHKTIREKILCRKIMHNGCVHFWKSIKNKKRKIFLIPAFCSYIGQKKLGTNLINESCLNPKLRQSLFKQSREVLFNIKRLRR